LLGLLPHGFDFNKAIRFEADQLVCGGAPGLSIEIDDGTVSADNIEQRPELSLIRAFATEINMA